MFAFQGFFAHWVPGLCFRVFLSIGSHALPHILGLLDATATPDFLRTTHFMQRFQPLDRQQKSYSRFSMQRSTGGKFKRFSDFLGTLTRVTYRGGHNYFVD